MDWIPVAAGCLAVSEGVARTSPALHEFVREVRESRSELDSISGELHSLNGVLDLLKDDAASFPTPLDSLTPELLQHCGTIVDELNGYISILNGSELSRLDKKFRWIATRQQLNRLGSELEGCKSTLGLALDLVALTKTARSSSGSSAVETPGSGPHFNNSDEVSRIVAELGRLAARVQREFHSCGTVSSNLHNYFSALQQLADAAGVSFEMERRSSSSIGEAPDSAIEIGDEPISPMSLSMRVKSIVSPSHGVALPIEEIDELLDELNDMPSRAPTPPPKALARSASTRTSVIISMAAESPADEGCFSIPGTPEAGPTATTTLCHQPQIPGRSSSIRTWADSDDEECAHPLRQESYCTVVTNLDPSDDTQSLPPSSSSILSRSSSRMSRIFSHMRNALSETTASPKKPAPSPPQPTKDREEAAPAPTIAMGRPSIASSSDKSLPMGPGLLRRGSRRFSTTFRSVIPFRPHYTTDEMPEEDEGVTAAADEPSDAVFGVPLQKSMQVAKGTAKTYHSGSGSSRREFPLCILKSCSYIQLLGIEAPDIFGEHGDRERLADLRDIFSRGPDYGENIDWTPFAVHEAADLILLFLSQLPKPLISESVAKRWISLSKQATMPGSHAVRLEQCIDFWEEALSGVRGPSRTLFKLLLNLWGEVADAADVNDMTAERLAAKVLRPLMHTPVGRYDTDFMLGLAFLIRKRSEYSMLVRGGKRKSNAAFEGQ